MFGLKDFLTSRCSLPFSILPWNLAFLHSQLQGPSDQCFQCPAKLRYLNPFLQLFNPRPPKVTNHHQHPCFPPVTTCFHVCHQRHQDPHRLQFTLISKQMRTQTLTQGFSCHRQKMAVGQAMTMMRDHQNVSFQYGSHPISWRIFN